MKFEMSLYLVVYFEWQTVTREKDVFILLKNDWNLLELNLVLLD